MTSVFATAIKPRSLTDCVFTNSVPGKLKHLYWRHILNGARSLRQSRDHEARGGDIASLANELSRQGLILGDASSFLSEHGRAALEESRALVHRLCQSDEAQAVLRTGANRTLGKDYLIHLVAFDSVQDCNSPLLKLALDPKLLRIIAAYLGMWPQLHAIGSWLNFPTANEAKLSQLWHRDPEDLRTVKVFIYLDEVGKENGPFCYIRHTHPFGSACERVPRHEHPRRVTDDEMDRALSRSLWFECTGPANTLIIADTVGFHRGGYVEKGRRLLVTFTYTSGTPQVKRWLRVSGRPGWLTSPIQRYALQ